WLGDHAAADQFPHGIPVDSVMVFELPVDPRACPFRSPIGENFDDSLLTRMRTVEQPDAFGLKLFARTKSVNAQIDCATPPMEAAVIFVGAVFRHALKVEIFVHVERRSGKLAALGLRQFLDRGSETVEIRRLNQLFELRRFHTSSLD